jgi:ABC-type lipoprotein export system ATPase subunit
LLREGDTVGVSAGGSESDRVTVLCECVTRSFRSPVEVVHAVRDADLVIEQGTMVGLYGASGSGKSTLVNLIAGIDVPTSGAVTVLGSNVGRMDESARARFRLAHIGVVFQDDNLIEEFTATENVMLPLEASGWGEARARPAARDALDRVGLVDLGHRRPAELSGGQRQRVGIARALAGERVLLLADEPTGALDSDNSRRLFELLRMLADGGVTVLLATHDRSSESFVSARYELRDGRPIAVATSGAASG